MSNTIKSVLLLGLLTGILVVMGRVLGGTGGMILAFGIAVAMNFGSYWFSDKIALKMAGAREVSPEEAPDLHRIVEELAYHAGLPKPRVAIVDSLSPNAFATGRDEHHAVVAATTGIMRILNRDELMAVLGHELGHVKNHDILIASIAATVAGAITMIAQMLHWAALFGGLGGLGGGRDREGGTSPIAMLAMMILAPIAALMIQMAISRSREFGADRTGAQIDGNPLALASALEKLDAGSKRVPLDVNPAAAHLFIVNPLGMRFMANLFSTHPPIEERIKRLRQMAGYPT
jgi:heat shock protein HtpX